MKWMRMETQPINQGEYTLDNQELVLVYIKVIVKYF